MRGAFCEWASCRNVAYAYEGQWWHCRDHLLEHRLLEDDKNPTAKNLHAASTREKVEQLHARGLSDRQISSELGLDPSGISRYRRDLGLEPNTPDLRRTDVQPCGTPAAYRRHLRDSEPPCAACTTAERVRRRSYYTEVGR